MATIYSNNETVNINPTDDLVLYKEEFINSRIEKFLYAICALDFDDLPTPLSRIEELYKCLATGLPAPTFVPQSRVEKYLMAILGAYDASALPAPKSRTEVLLNKILLGDTDLSDIEWLKSRYEFLLAYIAKSGENDIAKPIYFVNYSLDNGFTTSYNTIEYPVKSAILKGNTFVNLTPKFKDSRWVRGGSGGASIEITNDYLQATITNAGSFVFDLKDMSMFKPNMVYTFIIDVLENSFPSVHLYNFSWGSQKLEVGINKFTLTLERENPLIRIGYTGNLEVGSILKIANIVVMEGDYTNVDIPYFEGMTSVKMPVLTTTGKNMFDINKFKSIGVDAQGYYIPLKFVDNAAAKATLKLKPNTKYVVMGTYIYTGSAKFMFRINDGAYQNVSGAFTTDATGVVNIKIGSNTVDVSNPSKMEKIMIVESTLKDIYEPHKSNILTVNEPVELRGIGVVNDELNLITSELTQRIGEVVLDGSEGWGTPTNFNNGDCKAYSLSVGGLTSNIVCDSLKILPNSLKYGTEEGVFVSNDLLIVKKNIATRELLKQWLSQNQIIIQYQLATESIKTVDLSTLDQDGKETELSTFDDITHVTVSSEGLIPTGEITVATKNSTDVINAGIMSLRMDDISNSQTTLEESANAQSDDIDVIMLGVTDIYEQLL